ncbi:MAG: serine/threonine protein kinase [Deltaproteobacteria bacterium]|nr:serine/threonine protein kinase [Deltaproteobacteria bacterium]
MSIRRFPTRFGNYILLDRIASGGMAQVYRGKVLGVEQFQRLVAIKCMLPQVSMHPDFAKMFVDEAHIAAQLSHPNIVQILELGRVEDTLFIAMELVEGCDVSRLIRAAAAGGRRLPVQFCVYAAARAADGLDFAHNRTSLDGVPFNLVHRDVSPHNILVSYSGEIKVADFGIAKADQRASTTRQGVVKGKLQYMAPEQLMAEPIDRRTDVFALGAVLYEMLSGERLFNGESTFEVMSAVKDGMLPPIEERHPHIPPEIVGLLRKALQREARERFPTAEALAQELGEYLLEGGKIYGARQATELMGELFRDEMRAYRNKVQEYSQVTEADCYDIETTRTQRVELFQSHLSGSMSGRSIPTLVGSVTERAPARRPLRWFGLGLTAAALAAAVVGVARQQSGPEKVDRPAAMLVPAAPPRVQRETPPPPFETQASLESTQSNRALNDAADTASREPRAVAPSRSAAARRTGDSIRYGYVSIRAEGVDAAKIFLDGQDLGYSPVISHRVRQGPRRLRVVEESPQGNAKEKRLEIQVTSRHTEESPLRLIVEF